MENRDVAAVDSMMAADAKIVFPGGKVFDNQEEMVIAARHRYQWIKKEITELKANDQLSESRCY